PPSGRGWRGAGDLVEAALQSRSDPAGRVFLVRTDSGRFELLEEGELRLAPLARCDVPGDAAADRFWEGGVGQPAQLFDGRARVRERQRRCQELTSSHERGYLPQASRYPVSPWRADLNMP